MRVKRQDKVGKGDVICRSKGLTLKQLDGKDPHKGLMDVRNKVMEISVLFMVD